MTKTLEQMAEESRLRFDEAYSDSIRASGYSFSSRVSRVGAQELANGKVIAGAEGNKPCIVVYLMPMFDTALSDLDYMRRFTIKPEFEWLKVYVTGYDRKKKKEDPFILGRD